MKIIANFLYMCWTFITRIVYLPKITYEDISMKKDLKNKGVIFIANHTSHKDGSFVPQALRGIKPYVLVTRKWYDKKQINWLFRNLRYIPINLNDMDNDWMAKSKELLENNESILIFPEGKLCKDGNLGEFHSGFLMLARQTGVPVVPIAISGGYRLFHRQKLYIGKPVSIDVTKKGRPSVVLREAAEKCRYTLEEMLKRK